MITKELVDYVKAERATGKPDEIIKQGLVLSGGWTAADADQALAVASSSIPLVSTAQIPQANVVVAPASSAAPAPSSASHGHKLLGSFVVIILLAVAGFGAYAYQTGLIFSKAPYNEDNLLSGVLGKASTIKSASYAVSASLKANPRDAGAQPFAIDTKAFAQKEIVYSGDQSKVRDIQAILSSLDGVSQSANGTYPATLADLVTAVKSQSSGFYWSVPPVADLNGVPYDYARTGDGKSFVLKVTFATDEAVEQIKNYGGDKIQVQGKTVTFTEVTKDTGLYLSYSLPKPFLMKLADYSKLAPGNLDFTAGLSGTLSRATDGKPVDWRSAFNLSGDFDDLAIKVAVEARKVDGDYFVLVDKFPSFFFFSMFSPVKGQWIQITGTTTASNSGSGFVSSYGRSLENLEGEYSGQKASALEGLRTALRIADEEGVLSFKGNPVSEKLDGKKVYRYDLGLDVSNSVSFFERLSGQFKDDEEFGGMSKRYAEQLTAYLKSDTSAAALAYLEGNLFFSLWTDASGMPVKGEVRLRVVPPDDVTHLAGKQVDYVTAIAFSEINDPVKVSVPDSFISAEKADELIMGQSGLLETRAKGSDAAIKSHLANIRASAEIAYDKINSYAGVCSDKLVSDGLVAARDVTTAKKEVVKSLAIAGSYDTVTCHESAKAWVAEAPLSASVAGSPYMYCVDSTGAALQKTSVIAANALACR